MAIIDYINNVYDSDIPEEKRFTGTSLERELIQAVAICMNQLKITSMPVLQTFKNDNGIFEGIYRSHMNDPQVEILHKQYGDDFYFNLLGYHALGSGAYVTLCQSKYHKSVDEFSRPEFIEISNAFRQTDPYELALKTLGFNLDSENKKCLDHIVWVGMSAYRYNTGSRAFDKDLLRSYMQVMYNAGITVVLGDNNKTLGK